LFVELVLITHGYRDFVLVFHVVRGSDRLWTAFFSTELVIKQVLMRSLETSEGLTRGRDITEQQFIWLLSMPACAEKKRVFQECTEV